MRNAFFTGGKSQGVVVRIPGFHLGYPGSIPGHGIKILLHATTHCCLSKIKWTVRSEIFSYPKDGKL